MSLSARAEGLLTVVLLLWCAGSVQAEDVHILANGTLVFNRSSHGPRNCPLPGYCERQLQPLPASAYVGPPADEEMARQKDNVTAFLQSSDFKATVQERAALADDRGLLFVGGGPSLIGMIAVKLRLLRLVHGCTLPVEIAYYGDQELDNVTLATLQQHYGPVYALDLSQLEEPPHQHNFKVTRYTFKVMALQFTRFRKVFFIDADNMPLKDPSHMFESPQFTKFGNLFWPDYWRNGFFLGVSDEAYSVLGLNKTVVQPLFDDGSVLTERAAESGSLLLDRVAHADVLEYLVWINSFDAKLQELIKDGLMGDKDTFKMAFALAGKAHMYMQMPIPPGIGFSVGTQDNIEDKISLKKELGWAFNGMSQYDHLGDILFFHHTAQKWGRLDEDAVRVDAITGPAAMRWVRYYLAHDNLGPKRFTTKAHSVPLDALQLLDMPPAVLVPFSIDPLHPTAALELDRDCPWHKYLTIARFKSWGLPLSAPTDLIAKCKPVDPLVMRTLHHQYGPLISAPRVAVSGNGPRAARPLAGRGKAHAAARGAAGADGAVEEQQEFVGPAKRLRRKRRRQQRAAARRTLQGHGQWQQQQWEEMSQEKLLEMLRDEQQNLKELQQQQQQQQATSGHLAVLSRPPLPRALHRHLLWQAGGEPNQNLRALQQDAASSDMPADGATSDGQENGISQGTTARGIELPGVGPAAAAASARRGHAVRLTPALDEAHRAGLKRVLDPRYVDRIYWMSDSQELRDGTPLPALRINVPMAQGGDPRLVTLDLMQQVHVPEALAWLRSNYEQLPLLKPKS